MSLENAAYFDHNATTPLDPRVRDAMLPWFGELHGNPSSAHRFGRAARAAVDRARAQVATLIGGQPEEVVFTSSGTEANNAVIFAVAAAHDYRGHFILSSLEHPSIHAASRRMAERGIELTQLQPGTHGSIELAAVQANLRPDTRLLCLMSANNELGTLQPVSEISALCRPRGVSLLCDAVQAVGKVKVDVDQLGVDYLVIGGHKFHGPPGIAALWTRGNATRAPLLVGGAQEGGQRAGTENVPAIVGLGMACELARLELDERAAHLRTLRDHFEAGLSQIDGAVVHCQQAPRLPHTSHIALHQVSGHQLLLWLDEQGFAVSTGSACHAGTPQPSAVLLGMGLDPAEALSSLRISFGMPNTLAEADALLTALGEGVRELRSAA